MKKDKAMPTCVYIKREKEKNKENNAPKVADTIRDLYLDRLRKKSKITISDKISFRVNAEVRYFFGLGKKNVMKAFYPLKTSKKGDYLWLPHLSIQKGNLLVPKRKMWINLYDEQTGIIREGYYQDNPPEDKIVQINDEIENFKRITFAKSADNSAFHFLGVFEKTGKVEEEEINGRKLIFRIYQRVADNIDTNADY